jgi:hypothetical protein
MSPSSQVCYGNLRESVNYSTYVGQRDIITADFESPGNYFFCEQHYAQDNLEVK